ncbi:Swi5-domain-containing protein [Tirmania nivea]|nr:Swi5-domain-containing protein [Tirmania nivea]
MSSTDDSPPASPISTTLPTRDNLSSSAPSCLTFSSTAPTDTPASPSSTSSGSGPAKQARDRRVESLKSQVESLQKQLDEVIAKQDDVNSKLKDPTNPEATVKRHIKTLHEFNEIRDVAQGLLGLIADSRGVRVQDVYPEFGLDSDD